MATRARDTTPPAKRGTSPIHPQRTSKTTSPVGKPTTSNNKNIPSYLKPTLASSRDTNNNTRAKKSASSSDLHNIHNNKPALTRRLSFDRPPLPCSSPKTRISPNPKERILRSSSSSLSAKTSTSQKPLLDRFSKTAIGKQRGTTGLQSRPVTTTRKKTTTTTTTTRATRKHDSTTTKAPIVTDSQGKHSEPEDHQELTIAETEKEMIISDNEMAANSDVGDNDSAVDDHEELNGNVSNNVEPEDIKAAGETSSIVVETQEIRIEEAQEKVQVEEPEEMMNEAADDKLDSSSEKEKEEIATNESEENQEAKEEEEGTNQQKVQETEAVQQQQQQEEEEQQQQHDVEQIGESSEAVVEKNREMATSKPQPKPQAQVVQQGKKEGLSNDVIEETASRLKEQRKNKVRALASAFETVISLQHPK